MPIYEYKAIGKGCEYCQDEFEVRQGMDEEPIRYCPKCGASVRRLFSRPFICVVEALTEGERMVRHTPEEADKMGLIEGFAEDKIYDSE